MSDKFLQGGRDFHLVAPGSTITKCGLPVRAPDVQLLDAKTNVTWPTCALCAENMSPTCPTIQDRIKKFAI